MLSKIFSAANKESFSESSQRLIKSREGFKSISNIFSWIAIENILLNIINYLLLDLYDVIEEEIGILELLSQKHQFDNQIISDIRAFIFRMQLDEEGYMELREDYSIYLNKELEGLKRRWGLLKLVKLI